MAAVEIDALKKVRNALVQGRRKIVSRINALGPTPDVAELLALTDQVAQVQAGIDAIDRAIKDEGGLAPGAISVSGAARA